MNQPGTSCASAVPRPPEARRQAPFRPPPRKSRSTAPRRSRSPRLFRLPSSSPPDPEPWPVPPAPDRTATPSSRRARGQMTALSCPASRLLRAEACMRESVNLEPLHQSRTPARCLTLRRMWESRTFSVGNCRIQTPAAGAHGSAHGHFPFAGQWRAPAPDSQDSRSRSAAPYRRWRIAG